MEERDSKWKIFEQTLFLSDIDILTSTRTEVIKKILITYCHTFNIAINSICYDIIVKKVNTVFLS